MIPDFTILSNGIQNYLLSVLILSLAIGSIINMVKGIVVLLLPKVIKTKTYKLFLILAPYVVGIILYFLARLLKQTPDILQLILASSLSSLLYRVVIKLVELYKSKLKE